MRPSRLLAQLLFELPADARLPAERRRRLERHLLRAVHALAPAADTIGELPVVPEAPRSSRRPRGRSALQQLHERGERRDHRPDALEERVQTAARRAARAAEHLREWWNASTTSAYSRPPRWLVDAEGAVTSEEHLAAILARGRTFDFPESCRRVALAGAAGVRPLAEVEGWLREPLAPEGRSFRTVQPHLHGVRRFPNPRCERGPLHDTVRESFSVVDIGDVLARLAPETTRSPHVAVLLHCASELLGAALRDAVLLRRMLDNLAPHDRYHRFGAVVALGALGVLVEPTVLAGGGDDHRALEAYALAAGLAPLTSERRAAAVTQCGALLGAHVAARVTEFVERAAAGYTISIAL